MTLRVHPRRTLSLLLSAALVATVTSTVGTPARADDPTVPTGPTGPAPAADPDDVWTPTSQRPTAGRGGLQRRVAPSDYAGYLLDLGRLSARLDTAPSERADAAPVVVTVPSPDGELVDFAVTESPVMEPGLAARHPGIATYAGRAVDGGAASIRLDVTPMGFHAAVRGAGATWYVDPAYNGVDQGEDALYLSYLGSDLPEPERDLVEPDVVHPDDGAAREDGQSRVGEGPGAVAVQRTYRLALATDPSYAAHFGTTSDQVVTAEKVTLVNRVNQVYGDDLSIRLVLVAGNDALNFNTAAQFTGAGGRCGAVACYTTADVGDGCGDGTVLDKNRYVLGQLIGADRYDVGHIAFGPAGDGGGIAGLGVVGTTDRAAGCTGLNPPTGDGFAIDYVAHELGHQFAGNHTFNGTSGSCAGGNRNAGTSVEPGSGTSVMAYAGICGADNLQRHSDPYFSQRSQQEVATFTRSSPASAAEVQNVALTGFGAGEAITIAYASGTPQTLPYDQYNALGLKTALEAAEPSTRTATVLGYWGAGTVVTPTLTNGFQVTWSGATDVARPTVTVATGDVGVVVGTTDDGGPETNGGTPSSTGNRNPVVTAPPSRTIPIRTPFTLSGAATDPDGDAMVYLWEQNNVGGTSGTALGSNTRSSGPLFRVFGTYADVTAAGTTQYASPGENLATTSPTRSFPDAAQVAAGETNAATGSCSGFGSLTNGSADTAALRCYSEFLPTSARTLSFRLTARDLGGPDGGPDGGTAYADTTLTVGAAGPFLVTSQPSAASVTGGSTGTVTWNVASTDTATYATSVRILFSTDGGLTFPTVLAESTANDGAETVTWPSLATTSGRIRVEAVRNYFYDVNDGAITVTTPPTLTVGGGAAGQTFTAASSDPLATTPEITATSNTVPGSAITMTASGLPTGLALDRVSTAGASTTFRVTGAADADPGSYPVTVTVSDGPGAAADRTVSFTVVVVRDDAVLAYTGDTTSRGGAVTLSAAVADTDATPGPVAGTVVFTDQTTGEQLCSATVADGAAACTASAPATRTYRVVATLTSVRYAGASAPVTLQVTVPTLTVGGSAGGATFTVASSDPPTEAITVTATSNVVAGSELSASAAGLPAGLQLGRTSAAGGSATFAVTGAADADPGTYPVTIVVSDGPDAAADRTVSSTITVVRDEAVVAYTGETASEGGTVTASATVADTDATPGTVTGQVTFTDQTTGDPLCTAAVAAGAASCGFTAPATRTYRIVAALDGARYAGASAPAQVVVTVPVLTTAGLADGDVLTVASSDSLTPAAEVTATSNVVPGSGLSATVSGLPEGLALEPTATTATTRTFALTGEVDDLPGSYPVTVTLSDGDGRADDVVLALTVVVTRDLATLTWTGATSGTGGPVLARVDLADPDGHPGPLTGTVTFTDAPTGETLCTAQVAEQTASCTFTAPATRTYRVVAELGGPRYAGTSAPAEVTVAVDDLAPETTVLRGPANGAVVLARTVTFRFGSEPGATYTCGVGGVGGVVRPCDGGVLTLSGLAPGTYEVLAGATDAAGNDDPTPVTRRFTVPFDDRALTVAKGPWARRAAAASYRGTYSATSRPGATLTRRVSGAASLALVVSTGRRFGAVDVYVGQRRLARVATAGAPRSQRVVRLPAFGRPFSGAVRVVSTTRRPVRIDGLAVVTGPPAARRLVERLGSPVV